MREVAVHFANVVESVVQSPAEPRQIGRSQPLFAAALQQVKRFGELFPALPDDFSRPVGRTVVDDEQFERFGQRKDLVDHRRDVFLLVVGRNDYQFAHRALFSDFLYKGSIILQKRAAPALFLRGRRIFPALCAGAAHAFYRRRFIARISCFAASLTR